MIETGNKKKVRQMPWILIVDDDPHIRELVAHFLTLEGFDIYEAVNGKDALNILDTVKVDLLILDIMMPEIDGWQLCHTIRKYYDDIPILMLTVKSEIPDKVKGFEVGADDYLVKPFDPIELVVRVKALLRRYQISTSQTIKIGELFLNKKTYECRVREEEILLPPKEFELLFKLASYPGKTFTREQLIEEIWGYDYEGDERTVDVHIKRLREKFSKYCIFEIRTIRGLGYRLEVIK
jgi:DNA-binding response OmpR family regulator